MPVQSFAAQNNHQDILRIYSLRLSYEYCRQLDKDKSISSGLASHCIIIRQRSIANKTDFGYKEQLKTGILKKMHFVYLQKIQDLLAFLYQHIKYLEQNIHFPSKRVAMNTEQLTKANPLFGMLLVENIQLYFGDVFNYQSMGTKFHIFLKLMKLLQDLMPFNSNVCFTYNYNQNIFKYEQWLKYIKSQDITCWKVGTNKLQKNGFCYESQWTRKFYEIYEIQNQNNQSQ